jgi:membrane dipeptidase
MDSRRERQMQSCLSVWRVFVVVAGLLGFWGLAAPVQAEERGAIIVVNLKLKDTTSRSYGRLVHRVEELAPGADVREVHWTRISRALSGPRSSDALILGPQGTPWWEYPAGELEGLKKTIREYPGPVLGICGGHQFLAMAYGGTVAPIECPPEHDGYEGCVGEAGYREVALHDRADPILLHLPHRATLYESHYEEVKEVPAGFVVLGSTSTSTRQIIRLEERPVYGVQFHPEVFETKHPHGRTILSNFLVTAGVIPPVFEVADLHCDALMRLSRGRDPDLEGTSSPVSIEKLQAGRYVAQVFAVFAAPGKSDPVEEGRRQVRLYRSRVLDRSWPSVRQTTTVEEYRDNRRAGVVSAFLSIEGAHVLGTNASNLVWYVENGLRFLGLTWNNSNAFADGLEESSDPPRGGVTEEGFRLLRLMELHRVIPDLSHAHRETFWGVVTTVRGPVIASHSNAAGKHRHQRNLDDEQIEAIRQKQGLIGLCYHSRFIDGSRQAGLDDLVQHADYLKDLAGPGVVGLGSDFGGGIRPVLGVTDAASVQGFLWSLLRRGWSAEHVGGVAAGNFDRLMTETWGRFDEIPPLSWRPLRASSLGGRVGDEVVFDRLRSTGLDYCIHPGGRGRDIDFRVDGAGLRSLVLRMKSGDVHRVGVRAVLIGVGGETAPLVAGSCPTDGSRCELSISSEAEIGTQPSIRLQLELDAPERTCVRLQDIVPVWRVRATQ